MRETGEPTVVLYLRITPALRDLVAQAAEEYGSMNRAAEVLLALGHAKRQEGK